MPAAPRTCGVRATMNDELRAGSEAAPLRAAFPARRPDMHEAEAKAARTIRARATPGRPYCTSVATRRLSQPQERSEACAPSEGGSQPTPLTTSEWAAGTGRAASVERSTREREPEGQCRGHVGDCENSSFKLRLRNKNNQLEKMHLIDRSNKIIIKLLVSSTNLCFELCLLQDL